MLTCMNCHKEIPENSLFCNYCGQKVSGGTGQALVRHSTTKIVLIILGIVIFFAIAGTAVLALFFTPLSPFTKSGPPDDLIYKDNQHLVEGSNVKLTIINKSQCESLPAEVKALGVTEVWLVGLKGDGPYAVTTAYAKQNGNWRDVYSDKCP